MTTASADPSAAPQSEPEAESFADLGVLPATVEALAAVGITHPFKIQQMALPLALAGNDVIGQAKTGTGKTLGFGIPLLQRLTAPGDEDGPSDGRPQALVVVPTRELCIQVANDLQEAGATRGVRVLAIYGGRAYEPQIATLTEGVEVVVGTPGRLLDLLRQRHLDLSNIRSLVLDEADEMLDMGFLPDVEALVAAVPADRQTMLFSATMPGQILNLARRYMTQPTHIRASEPGDESATVAAIEQHAWRTHAMDKVELLSRILQAEGRELTIVFTRTKRTAQKVADELNDRGFAAAAVHGDLGQGAREQALRAFRSGKVDVLVATDVAARGIDIDDVTHVVNYQCPEDEKIYLHRIGRTGRAGASGVAITFVDWDDVPRWKLINNALGLAFADPIETYSTSPHVYTGLGIPEGAKGRLPSSKRTRAGLEAEELEDVGETGKRSAGGRSQGGKSSGKSGGKSGGAEGTSGRNRGGRGGQGRGREGGRGGSGSSGSRASGTSKPRSEGSSASSGKSGATGDGTSSSSRRRRRRRRSGSGSGGSGTGSSTD